MLVCSRFLGGRGSLAVAAAARVLVAGEAISRDLVVSRRSGRSCRISHQDGSGFDNRIAEASSPHDLGARLVYRWQPLRRGVVRKTLGAGLCDVLMGVPADPAGIATTIAYYRSSYALVTRKDWGVPVASFDDARLRASRVGVPLIGADGAAAPPALTLARRGISAQRDPGLSRLRRPSGHTTDGGCACQRRDRHRAGVGPVRGLLRTAGEGPDRSRVGTRRWLCGPESLATSLSRCAT